MKLSGIRQTVFLDRYSLKDEKGNPVEKTPEQMWKRVAHGISQVEKSSVQKYWAEKFESIMQDFKFVPGGRILSGAGTGYNVTFYNCFVIPSPKDSREGILDTLKQMVEIMARGGGVGINLSSLRPRGARVKKVNGFSSGPCNWAELFSVATKDIIQQGGTRRGALMLMLWDWHPDVEEFITVKRDLSRINGANLSVCVSDKFMEAVKKDDDWQLYFPDTNDREYDTKWEGYMDEWLKMGKKVKVFKTIKARKLWDLICEAAWASAEPGVVFMERYNKWSNNWYFNKINCVNPCVTGDTLVSTTNGLQSMRKLYEIGKPFRVVVDGKNYLSTHVKHTGVKPVYRLRTREGYEMKLTNDHKVITVNGKKEADELVSGDKILLSHGGSFGVTGNIEEGNVLGWLVGDGTMKKDVATLFFYHNEKQELAPQFASMVGKMVEGEGVTQRMYPIFPQYIEKENKAVVESVRLWRIAYRYGITHENKYIVPEQVFGGSEEFQRGFLQGLFSSDGTVIGTPNKGVSVRLTSVSYSLLIGVQRLLLNLGILSKIYKKRRTESNRLLPDGRGGKKSYYCQAYHELVISKVSLIRFAALINFLQDNKKNKLASLLSLYGRGPYKESFMATFSALEKDGVEEVFDITVADIHRFSANGLIVSNCGEEGLPAWGVCNLCSINLAALVKDGKIDYKELSDIAKVGVRFQDDIIDADSYVFPQIRQVQQNGERRIGLGTMGLGDALIKMKLRYGSPESLREIDKIYKTIRDAAYESSVEIAKEKSPFREFDAKKHLKGHFIKRLPKKTLTAIKKWGVRNSVLLQQAPTGSTSLLAGVSSGIEPVYEFSFVRRDRLGEHTLYHPLYEEWKKSHPNDPVPPYFVSANDLIPEDHVRVQGAIQKYVDASISKTVNAPNNHTIEDVRKLYTLAYELGCKGVTYMREGSRPGVLERIPEKKDEKESVQKEKATPNGNGHLPVREEIMPRPMMVAGATYQIDTPVGTAFVTINTDANNQPLEVFINVGKAGSDVTAMAEALGRIVSLMLRMQSSVPASERARQVFNQLIGIGGSKALGFGDKRVRSLPDAVAKVLAMHYGFKFKNGNGNGHQQAEGNPQSVPVLTQQSLPVTKIDYDLCPSCGEAALAYEEGCKKCYSCGYSEC
ncbi:hypothetical protein HYW55_06210 [Candidatus Gottesmanbacteria bacterium]|nr:hypothetical protein [Candidatus Gottesmanbacteria bacterium]